MNTLYWIGGSLAILLIIYLGLRWFVNKVFNIID